MPTWLRNPTGALLLAVLLVSMAGIASLADKIGHPFGGYASTLFFLPLSAPGGIVVQETPAWWPIRGINPPLDEYTYLLEINDQPYQSADVGAVFERAWDMGAKSVTILVDRSRGGRLATIEVPVIRFDFIHFLELKLPDLITGFCLWLTALAVLKARPQEPLNQVFAVIASLVALQRWTVVNAIWVDLRVIPVIFEFPIMAAAGFIGVVLLHFALLFPRRIEPWPRRLLPALYGMGVVLTVLHMLSRVPAIYRLPEPRKTTLLLWSDRAFLALVVLYLTGITVLFCRMIWFGLRGRHSRRDRRVALIVLIGLMAALPMILITADSVVPGLGVETVPFWRGLDLRYLFVTVPLGFALAIIRYQSMRSPSRLLIVVIALAGSALLAAILSWLWGLSQGNWPANGEHPPFPYLFAGIFAASVFWSTQATWRGWFGRLLEWDTHSYTAARAFGRRVSGTTNLIDLSQTIAAALVNELQLDRAAVWLWKPEPGAFELAAEAGQTDPSLPARLSFSEDYPSEANRPLRLDAADDNPSWLESLNVLRTIDVVVPLQTDGQPIGLLGLGHRWDEEIFDDRDLAIAELVGQQAALFLLAAMQIEELRHVPQQIVAAQESERRRLAAELHDTVQQFLGGLPFALAFTTDEIRADPEGVAAVLEHSLEDVESMAETVRRIRFNLAPSQLEYSLTRSLSELVAHVAKRAKLRVSLSTGEGLDQATALITREALYRVIQQALDNIVAHAEASEANLRLECADGRVTFSVTDDGRGSTEAERREADRLGHFGLSAMRQRVELCGGEFTFASTPGEGTIVSGWVPAIGEAATWK